MLNSAPSVMIDCQPIAARKTELTHLLIDFSLLSHATLNNLAIHLSAWLRIFVSVRSELWPIFIQFQCSYSSGGCSPGVKMFRTNSIIYWEHMTTFPTLGSPL